MTPSELINWIIDNRPVVNWKKHPGYATFAKAIYTLTAQYGINRKWDGEVKARDVERLMKHGCSAEQIIAIFTLCFSK